MSVSCTPLVYTLIYKDIIKIPNSLGSQVLTVQQSLIVVFAHLIQNNLNDVVNFLTSTPGPQGSSAFDFVMYEWVTKQHLFSGPYDIKVR
jgi:hypothetical protein